MKKEKKQSYIKENHRADGTTEYIITKSPQKTTVGKIVIILLCLGLGGATLLSLIFALAAL